MLNPKNELNVARTYTALVVLLLVASSFVGIAFEAKCDCAEPFIQIDENKTLKVSGYSSVEMICVANKIVGQRYSSKEIVGILKFLLSEELIDKQQLIYLLPLLFPAELQDASEIPSDCLFAKDKNGLFTWQFPFQRIIVYDDFPVECVGTVGNAGLTADERDILKWLRDFGKCRETPLNPPNDLIAWCDQFFISDEFLDLSEDLNLSKENVRSVVRYRVIQALNFLPGAETALHTFPQWQLSESDWNQFLELSKDTRPMVIWTGTNFKHNR